MFNLKTKNQKLTRRCHSEPFTTCHPEPFAFCHAERSEASQLVAQGKLREESLRDPSGIALRMTTSQSLGIFKSSFSLTDTPFCL
jgi:hypothetical protein